MGPIASGSAGIGHIACGVGTALVWSVSSSRRRNTEEDGVPHWCGQVDSVNGLDCNEYDK